MRARFLAAAYSRRPAPRAYDSTWLNNELARLSRAVPSYVIRNVTTSTTMQPNDGMLVVNATSGAITVTLPAASAGSGQPVTIKKSDATANAVTIGGIVDSVLNRTLANQNDSIIIQSDGTNWFRPTLTAAGSGTYPTPFALTVGTYLTMTPGASFDGSVAQAIATNATSAATPSTLVARDSSAAAYLTLLTAAQPNITTVGVLAGLGVSLDGSTPTNWLEYTQQFDAASWARTTMNVTANTIAAPDGTTTADTIATTSSGGYIEQSITCPSASRVTLSFYIKRLTTTNQTNFYLYGSTSGTPLAVACLWTGDAITSVTGAGGGGAAAYTFSDEGGGWYRVSAYSSTTLTLGESLTVRLYARNASNSGSIYVWGAQLESGTLTAYSPNASVYTALAVTGITNLSSTLYVGGAVTLASTLAVTGKVGIDGTAVSTTTGLALAAGTTGVSALRSAPGSQPTSRVSGDIWGISTGINYHAGTTTVGPMIDNGEVFLLMGA